MGVVGICNFGDHGKRRRTAVRFLVVFLTCFLSSVAAFANPQSGTVSSGSASIVTLPNVMDINQTSQRAVIDWRSFNIAPNETTNFNQPNSSAVTLNRINNSTPSHILGSLNANGNVILISPNGVFFGQGSKVDVNGLVATTANISNSAFMQGSTSFSQPGNPNATVSNAGTITASQAGLIGLVAPKVENSGVLNAKLGRVMLGSGDTFSVDLYGDGLINVGVSGAVKQQVIQNSGTINAAGGTIQLTAAAGRNMVNSLINVPGKLNAPAAGMQDGEIVISAAGSNGTSTTAAGGAGKTGSSAVVVSGNLNASGYGAGQTGGTVNVTGDNVTLASGALIDASGAAGGGTVNIGGNLHGQGPLANAVATNIASGAQVKANAVTSGNGGQVTVWSDDQSEFDGTIEAKGGVAGGNGGMVETSSHGVLSVGGIADTSSPHGSGGEWLLDPASLTISNGSDTNVVGNPNFVPDGTVATSNLTPGTIDTALNAGTNVTVTTGGDAFANVGDITVNNAILTTGTGSLTLSSYRNIILNAGITLAGGALTLRADNAANGSGHINVTGAISTAGGNITMGGGNGAITAGSGYAAGNAGQVAGVVDNGVAIDAGGGNIIVNGRGFNGAGNNNDGVVVNGGSISTTGAATISISGSGSGNTNSGADYGVYVLAGGVVSSVNGNLAVTSSSGGGAGTGGGNNGVYVTGAGSTIETTGSGSVSITGTGGNGAGSGASNNGVFINTAAAIQATGSGTITVSGTGGNSSGNTNHGVVLSGSIVGSGGAISVTGTGGAGSGANNIGVLISTGTGVVSNTGAGTVSISGTGGGTGNSGTDYGVAVNGNASAVNGNINVSGTGGGAGTGGSNYGFYVIGAGSSLVTTGSGNISVSSLGGNGSGGANTGVVVSSANGIQTTGSGNVTVMTNTLTLNAANDINSIDNLTIQPETANTTVGVGTGAGTLSLPNNYFSSGYFAWGAGDTLTIGGSNAGTMDINTTSTFANPAIFMTGSTGNIILDNTLTSSVGSGTSLILASGQNFVNNVGAAAINPGGGRWLSYSTNPASDTINSLSDNFRRFSCVDGGACPAFPAAGNGFLYSTTPLLTITPSGQVITYGSAVPSLTGYSYTISGYLGGDSPTDSIGGSVNGSTTYTPISNVGAYNINYTGGALTSALGYGFSYANNPGAITVNPAALSITANSFGKTYGTTYSFAGSEFTAAGLVNGDTVSSVSLSSPGAAAPATVTGSPYAITGSGAVGTGLSNYTISYVNGNLTVTPYLLTVTANAQSKVYGAADPALTYTNGALQNGDTAAVFSGGLTRVAGETVAGAPYAINQGTLSAGANYTISYTGNNLTITPATLSITADNIHKTFGTIHTFLGNEYTETGLVSGDTVSGVTLASAGAPAAATTAGSPYAIFASGATGTGLANYNITYNNGVMFVVTPVTTPTIPPTVIIVANGGGSGGGDGSGGNDGGGNDGGGSDGIRTTHNTSASVIPVNPCGATSAQDTLPNQMTAMLDLIKISPELAETLPFYKIQTHSFDASHIACGDSWQSPQQ